MARELYLMYEQIAREHLTRLLSKAIKSGDFGDYIFNVWIEVYWTKRVMYIGGERYSVYTDYFELERAVRKLIIIMRESEIA